MTRRLAVVLALLLSLATAGPACHKEYTTAPALAATCAANPANGVAPLSVAFSLGISGAQGAYNVVIDYGDGAQGSEPGQPHLYGAAGTYNAAFVVTTPTQSARCSTVVTVLAPVPTPTPSNQPPDVVFHTNPQASSNGTITGTAPLDVHFNVCQTSDPDNDRLRIKMDLDGDGVFEVVGSTGGSCRSTHTYAAGTQHATVCVTDIDCPTWPSCAGAPILHPYQCRSYTIVVSP
ncbi:MAG TPA: hypothetical protein VMX54_22450 [Vicinamibacteria bacterium]|nr:hypothetical protein [Vicinamibacteria bacterium]